MPGNSQLLSFTVLVPPWAPAPDHPTCADVFFACPFPSDLPAPLWWAPSPALLFACLFCPQLLCEGPARSEVSGNVCSECPLCRPESPPQEEGCSRGAVFPGPQAPSTAGDMPGASHLRALPAGKAAPPTPPGPQCEVTSPESPSRLSSGPTIRLFSGPCHCLPAHPVLTISKCFFQFSFHCFARSPHCYAGPVRTGGLVLEGSLW